MRTEQEILDALSSLNEANVALLRSMERLTQDGEAFDDLRQAFDANGCYIAALEWALGADTLKFTSKEDRCQTIERS